ncbi:hypothetical protein JCM3766R1_006530 [Sporobolomyces carnicolor]
MLPTGEPADAPDRRRRRFGGPDDGSNRTTPDGAPDGDLDELEYEEEEEARSNDGSSDADEADGDPTRPSTSGTRTNSTSSTTNDGNGGVAVPTKTQAAFVGKLWSMLYTPSLGQLIAWTDDGRAFTVFHPTEFARNVLPQFFKHSNFASFIRQLNMYGFGKRVNDTLGASTTHLNSDGSQVQAWEFQNPAFQRDRPDLLTKIRRKSAKPAATIGAAPANRRRPSIVRTASSKQRRDVAASDGGDDDDDPAPRIGNGSQTQPPSQSMLFGDGARPSSPGVKVVAGLTEFAPMGTHPGIPRGPHRPRSNEGFLENPPLRSPTAYLRHQPSYPPPPPPPGAGTFYHHPSSSHPSPRSQMYPLGGPPPFYSTGRPPPTPEDPSTRQLAALEAQVRNLGDALFHTQQEYTASRAASYTVLGMLLGVVADLDVHDKRKEQIEACSIALSKLHPDAPGVSHNQGVFASHPPPPHPAPNGPYAAYPPLAPSGPPTPQNPNYQSYNRIPTAESYTRSSRPEPLSAPPPSSHPLPSSYRPSTDPQPSPHPNSPPARPSTSGSTSAAQHQQPQPTPSGLATSQHRFGASFANPVPHPNRPTSLPSLSSLLEGVPANGERRPGELNGRESEPPDERLRKKMRQ